MSQVIRISEPVYRRVEYLAKGVDTPAKVIERLLDFYDEHNRTRPSMPSTSKAAPLPNILKILNPFSPGNIAHTKIIEGTFGNESVRNWKNLVCVAHKHALAYFGDFKAVEKETISKIVLDAMPAKGYRACHNLGFSIRGENAKISWRNALHLAQKISTHIEILLQWKDTNKAAFPGQIGKLAWTPESTHNYSRIPV